MRSPLQLVRIEPRAHCCQRSNVNDLLVAIAYVMQKYPYVFPIIGGRKVEHLYQNLEALEISLSAEHIAYLESVHPFDLGFPCNRFVSPYLFLQRSAYLQGF